ncbi:hypothetical protein WMO40_20770 [Bacillaceae bacterium CLA-AA-H227]|uniref:Uncharacterized protein n=2 Tax=Robertmurraya TaxID=2837507 RepID=A0A4U1D0M6_9BACI|nr:hypothetical protein [Robertmurraya kyonggiensis]TKC15203.1 hypothetical protein FA727_20185 [Robertmurraya kyonggiensis]
MANSRGAVAVPVREQSEIFESRRKRRRAQINSVHAEVRTILKGSGSYYGTTHPPRAGHISNNARQN